MADIIWSDRKRPVFGLPWSFTRYSMSKEKLIMSTGLLAHNEEEVRLYRIMDITLKRSLFQRIFGVGTIHCCSADKSTPEFDLSNIKDPKTVRDMLSDLVEAERMKKRVVGREYMAAEDAD